MMSARSFVYLIFSGIFFVLLSTSVSVKADSVPAPPLDGFTPLGAVSSGNTAYDGLYSYEYFSDGLRVRCEIITPAPGISAYPPALIICHGGINGVTNRMRRKALDLARDGYLVAMPSYRGEDGSDGDIEVAAGEVDDVLACFELLRNSGRCDPAGIAIIGTSHGALIAALAASRDNRIPAVVCAYGVMDIIGWWYYLQDSDQYEEDALSRRIYGGGPYDHPREFELRSAVGVACDIEPPVLIIQGANDRLVPPSQAEALVEAFENCGKINYSYNLYPGVGHGFIWWDDGDSNGCGPAGVSEARSAWDDIFAFTAECRQRQ